MYCHPWYHCQTADSYCQRRLILCLSLPLATNTFDSQNCLVTAARISGVNIYRIESLQSPKTNPEFRIHSMYTKSGGFGSNTPVAYTE